MRPVLKSEILVQTHTWFYLTERENRSKVYGTEVSFSSKKDGGRGREQYFSRPIVCVEVRSGRGGSKVTRKSQVGKESEHDSETGSVVSVTCVHTGVYKEKEQGVLSIMVRVDKGYKGK